MARGALAAERQVLSPLTYKAKQRNTVAGGLRDLLDNKLAEKRGTTSGLPPVEDRVTACPAAPKPSPLKGKPKRQPVRPVGAGEVIWGLTDLGLDAAKSTLPSSRKVGGRARSVGRASGAPHAMAVNNVIMTFTSPVTPGEPIGTIADWVTEAPHPLPGDRGIFADAVLTAPQDGVPLLVVEVDLHHETPEFIAEKIDRYAEYCTLTYNAPKPEGVQHFGQADKLPVWRRRYPGASTASLPPIALVLGGAGALGVNNLANKVMNLTQQHWKPTSNDRWADNPFDFTGSIPIMYCHLSTLLARGPHAPIWWRFGSQDWQTLPDALANTEYTTRTQARLAAEKQAAEDAEQARLDATRCPGCNRHENEYDYKPRASDGTKLCADCEDAKADAEKEKQLQAARAAHARRWPCYTCKGPLGGAHGNPLEPSKEVPPDTAECPQCNYKRYTGGRDPLVLTPPTARELRQAKRKTPDDPWWELRLIHAEKARNSR
ncbi:replication-relaxation family protein [Kitasatospora sp. NPDC004289]